MEEFDLSISAEEPPSNGTNVQVRSARGVCEGRLVWRR
jgi:hypothetical protein